MTKTPKSYLSNEEREQLLLEGGIDIVCVAEASEARRANDVETYWQWLSIAKLPTTCLKLIKKWHGADFIRSNGFDTSRADAELGTNWLEANN